MAKKKPSRKSATIAVVPQPKKIPKWGGPPAHEGFHISWRFCTVDKGGSWPWAFPDPKRAADVLTKLGEFETMTDYKSKKDKISVHPTLGISKEMRRRLTELNREADVERLMSFHITGAGRVWCVPYDGVMMVLWWDPHHSAYHVGKKGT